MRVMTLMVMPRKYMTIKEEMTEMGKREAGDDRRAPRVEETEDDEDRENAAEDEGLFDVPD